MKKLNYFIYLILAVCFFLSCSKDDNDGIGPCVHTYNEPILNVSSINDTLNNISLQFVKLYDLKINGFKTLGLNAISTSYSIVSGDSIFYCNVPFGFGVEEGKYEFIIEADGYNPKKITIENVNYSIFEGGCPSYNDGGTQIILYFD